MDDPADIQQKARKSRVFLSVVVGLLGFVVLLGLLGPWGTMDRVDSSHVRARNAENQCIAAVRAYETEYGHLPGDRPSGVYEDPAGNAQVFAALRALDKEQNPLRIVFYEARSARLRKQHTWESAKVTDGFDPKTGVLLDPYGQPYRLRLRAKRGELVVSPYRDLPTLHHESTIIWSVGEDGRQGNREDAQNYRGSDDIVSWEQ